MINVVELGANDIFVIKIDVGQMPPARAKEYLEAVKVKLKETLGEQPMMIFPVREEGVEISIIKRQA